MAAVDGESLQIFTRNQRQWNAPPATDEEVRLFSEACARFGPSAPLASHCSYLINLASANTETAENSTPTPSVDAKITEPIPSRIDLAYRVW